MKKLFCAAVLAVASILSVAAQDVVKTLYSGDPVSVSWETPAYFGPDVFAEGVSVGNFINIKFSRTTDVIELKADGKWLPGSTFTVLGDNRADYRAYITADMLAALQTYGLEIVGKSFDYTAVEICNDGFNMPQGAIWGGFFWMDSWSTLEIRKTALANYKGQRWMDIYMDRSQDSDNTDYIINVRTSWNDDGIVAENPAIAKTPMKATVDLKNVNLAELLTKGDNLLVQCNKEGGHPFNLTAVALRYDESVTSVEAFADNDYSSRVIYNLQGVAVRTDCDIDEARQTLPAGIYIADGRKFVVR